MKQKYHQRWNRQYQLVKNKDKYIRFTFPINYPCSFKAKRKLLSSNSISNSSQSSLNKKIVNSMNRLKSAVSISFIDDKNEEISINKVPKEIQSSSLLKTPPKTLTIDKLRSSNAHIEEKRTCHLCGSLLSNGICPCIVQHLLELNNTIQNEYPISASRK